MGLFDNDMDFSFLGSFLQLHVVLPRFSCCSWLISGLVRVGFPIKHPVSVTSWILRCDWIPMVFLGVGPSIPVGTQFRYVNQPNESMKILSWRTKRIQAYKSLMHPWFWNIYLHENQKFKPNVGKIYNRPMEHMGIKT